MNNNNMVSMLIQTLIGQWGNSASKMFFFQSCAIQFDLKRWGPGPPGSLHYIHSSVQRSWEPLQKMIAKGKKLESKFLSVISKEVIKQLCVCMCVCVLRAKTILRDWFSLTIKVCFFPLSDDSFPTCWNREGLNLIRRCIFSLAQCC